MLSNRKNLLLASFLKSLNASQRDMRLKEIHLSILTYLWNDLSNSNDHVVI